MMGRKKTPNSRWVAGNRRYDERTEAEIQRKYREHDGWYQGAKVRRK